MKHHAKKLPAILRDSSSSANDVEMEGVNDKNETGLGEYYNMRFYVFKSIIVFEVINLLILCKPTVFLWNTSRSTSRDTRWVGG